MFFCWDDMLHPLEDLALQFCVLLEYNVLETVPGLLQEHVKYILHWSVSHCVNTHSNSKGSSKSMKDQAKTHPQVNG